MIWVPLLLADRSACLRILVLRELLDRPVDDPEVVELRGIQDDDPLVSSLLKTQSQDGSWKDAGSRAGSTEGGRLRATAFALMRLGYGGLDREHRAIKRGVEFVFAAMKGNGTWPMPKAYDSVAEPARGYTMAPSQTSIPLLAVAAVGCATDPRAERAYDWLLEQRLDDGAWPVGKIGKVYGYQAGYRQVPHSRWGCRTNTTLALTCLALHPTRRTGTAARRALDLLLARETRDRQNLGLNVARVVGAEPQRGVVTYHARFDPALILDLCWRIEAARTDERVDDLVRWIVEQQGPYGLWEYEPRPEASRWVSFDILRSLSRLDSSTDWLSSEPRTPYVSYPKKPRRF